MAGDPLPPPPQTTHRLLYGSPQAPSSLASASIALVVTSPPYPMIEMWDGAFSDADPVIAAALASGDGRGAFDLMHRTLEPTWREMERVLVPGGIACINIGDAVRSIGGDFQLFNNHARILENCQRIGFVSLPCLIWRKPTNAPNKFMGSGMLPAGAYVTLEHEHILVFRKGNKREFKSKEDKLRRMKSAFFWEERNVWFSDMWEDLKGTKQNNIDKEIRERSGAYPFELAYRIINMFSLREDTVLDPFLGTGTTTMAAMATARNSVGYEIDPNFGKHLFSRFEGVVDFSNQLIENRIANHLKFVKERTKIRGGLGYVSKVYGFPVMTSQETEITFDELSRISKTENEVEVQYKETPTFQFSEGALIQKGKSLKNWLEKN